MDCAIDSIGAREFAESLSEENLYLCSSEEPARWIVITGGPGVGKTSIVKHYEVNGYHVVHEAATDIIRQRLAEKVEEPWNHPDFNHRVVSLQLSRQAEACAKKTGLVFFDRSPVDTLSYCVLQKDKVHHEKVEKVVQSLVDKQSFHPKVFLIENLGACENNEIRPESLEEALRIEKEIEAHYRKYNFEVIRIPYASVAERARLILQHLKTDKTG
jgi:predicted ATPase